MCFGSFFSECWQSTLFQNFFLGQHWSWCKRQSKTILVLQEEENTGVATTLVWLQETMLLNSTAVVASGSHNTGAVTTGG